MPGSRGRDSGCPLPPAQTRARAASAHGSHLGDKHARAIRSRTHTRPTGVADGLWLGVQHRPSFRESPWPIAFPPSAPPTVPRPCSRTSSVLCDRSTPRSRTCGTYRFAFSHRPANCLRAATGPPGSRAWSFSACLGSLTPRGRATLAVTRRRVVAFLASERRRLPESVISELYTQPTDTPVQRFECGLTTALTWLGVRVVRYAFPVRLLHSLLHAGLSRRYLG